MPPVKKIRVLVADDSTFMCKVLKEIINSDPQLEVAGQARDGREAVSLAETLKPDVITMDINMPHLDGLQATELIMSQNPRPIVIVSSESREGAAETLRALLVEREPTYALADLTVHSRDVSHDAIVADIMTALAAFLEAAPPEKAGA